MGKVTEAHGMASLVCIAVSKRLRLYKVERKD